MSTDPSALSQRSQALHNIVRRLKRDAQGEPSSTALYEYAELDVLVAEAFAERLISDYERLARLRLEYAKRIRTLPALFRPTTSIPDDDDPFVREHLRKIGVPIEGLKYRVGRVLDFDPSTEQFTGDKEANALLTRQYRYPFTIPEKV